MQKLTVEQAEWLIKKIAPLKCVNSCYENDDGSDSCVVFSDLKKIINQCTEREFPKFFLQLHTQSEVEKHEFPDFIEILNWCNDNTKIQIDYHAPNTRQTNMFFTFKQFKQFAAGCNEIVRWIEEQE